jgi:hypothetical protein
MAGASSISPLGSAIENAKRAGYGQTQTAGLLHAFPLIHDDEVRFQVQRQQNRVMWIRPGSQSRPGGQHHKRGSTTSTAAPAAVEVFGSVVRS